MIQTKQSLFLLLIVVFAQLMPVQASRLQYLYDNPTSTTYLVYTSETPTTWEGRAVEAADYEAHGLSGFKFGSSTRKIVITPSVRDYAGGTLAGLFGDRFSNKTRARTIEGLEYLNTQNVTDMSHMFKGCVHPYTLVYLPQGVTFLRLSETSNNKWLRHVGLWSLLAMRAYLKYVSGAYSPELSTRLDDGTTGITHIELRDERKPEASRIFDLNGRYLGTRREVLPAGTYIINGQTTRLTPKS